MARFIFKIIILVTWVILIKGESLEAKAANIHNLDWNGLEVVWLEDDRFPTYSFITYFADGALSDKAGKSGETEMMFDLIGSGTTRYNQKQISDALEFYGVSYGASVTHEQSIFSVSGLVKDITPTFKMICHLFGHSTFPVKEVSMAQKRAVDGLINLVSNPSGLASRALRKITLASTEFSLPSGGTIKTIRKIKSRDLQKKLSVFNTKVKKRIYITGPKEALSIARIINTECGWDGDGRVRGPSVQKKSKKISVIKNKKKRKTPEVYLIPVKGLRQAKIMLGRSLPGENPYPSELNSLASHYLGGGFSSVLMQELRVKRGLTYGAMAMLGMQKYYGRVVVATSTRNEKTGEVLSVIKDILKDLREGSISAKKFKKSAFNLAGRYYFRLEKNSDYLRALVMEEHLGRSIEDLHQFRKRVLSYRPSDVQSLANDYLEWEDLKIVVVGDPSLKKSLGSFGPVKVIKSREVL